jgi:hypothetical protein
MGHRLSCLAFIIDGLVSVSLCFNRPIKIALKETACCLFLPFRRLRIKR